MSVKGHRNVIDRVLYLVLLVILPAFLHSRSSGYGNLNAILSYKSLVSMAIIGEVKAPGAPCQACLPPTLERRIFILSSRPRQDKTSLSSWAIFVVELPTDPNSPKEA
jgi:hypothetical protein